MKDIIGFWGNPHEDVIKKAKLEYPNAKFVDLDIDFNYPTLNATPEAYCGIIKNMINNSFYLKDRIIKILASVGKEKCDSGFFAAQMLKEAGFEVETSCFKKRDVKFPTPISKSSLPLKEKVEKITANIIEEVNYSQLEPCTPRFGFWGVPPNDLSILELFPNETEVFGWTRCVEAKCPANIELEMMANPNLPTVFFAQTFCSKTMLARHLAQKYNGLYIDIDIKPTKSTITKIEAFLRLR